MNPVTTILNTLRAFASFVGVGDDLVDAFAEEHPELIDENHPDAPPKAPDGNVDPDVRRTIEKGDL